MRAQGSTIQGGNYAGGNILVKDETSGGDLSLDVQDPDDVHLLGPVSHDRVFWISLMTAHNVDDIVKDINTSKCFI